MKKIEILMLKGDSDKVMRSLGFAGCVQLISEQRDAAGPGAEEQEAAELKIRLQSLAHFLGVSDEGVGGAGIGSPDRRVMAQRAGALLEATKPVVEEESRLLQRRLALRQAADELAAFSRVTIPLEEMQRLSYLTVRVGAVAPERLPELTEVLAKRALVLPLARPGSFIAFAPRKGRWALDSELTRHEFQASQFPPERKGVPADMLAALREELSAVERSLGEVESRKAVIRREHGAELAALLADLDLSVTIDSVKQTLASTGSVHKVTGWIPARRVPAVLEGLDSLTRGRMAVRVFDPSELREVKSGKVKVPVSTPHGRLLRSFDRMVFSYAVPLYGTIDPTPFVAVMFIVLFAVMFGDVGQGFVGVCLGLLINSGRIGSFEPYRRKSFGTTFLLAGLASMVSGFLYGSFFANDHVLEPATRFVTRLLFGRPLDHIVSLVGFQKIILFFGITIGVGAIINSVGLVINIVNYARRRDWEKAILSKTGAAGAVFFWYALSIGVRVAVGGRIGTPDFAALAVPLLALFFKDPIMHLATGHRPLLKEGLFSFIMEGIVEILESTIYYISNSVSFLRVAAFALAHTVLSSIVFLLSDLVGGAPGGIAFRILVILIGNSIIIVLEGLIVTIQVVRLQYYEFFSKFFNETGEEFSPFILRHREV
ncbi:MAG: V-type ATP synthase subunit I [Spirochaetia bacterium]